MLGLKKKSPDRTAAHERVRAWTRARFKLADDKTIMVSEIACSVPGCPPVETHIVFWTQAGRHHFKVFKPLMKAGGNDSAAPFMNNAQVAPQALDPDVP